jgi:hypothetical protein
MLIEQGTICKTTEYNWTVRAIRQCREGLYLCAVIDTCGQAPTSEGAQDYWHVSNLIPTSEGEAQ